VISLRLQNQSKKERKNACLDFEINEIEVNCMHVAYRGGEASEERLPSGGPTKEFVRMIFEQNSSRGTVPKFSQRCRQLLVEVRRGAGKCHDPCVLGRVLDSAFMQARVRLSCSNSII